MMSIPRTFIRIFAAVGMMSAVAAGGRSLAAAGQTAAETKTQAPPPGPVRPFDFPDYTTRKLANGLTVFVIEDHRQPLVSYTLLVNAGSIAHAPRRLASRR
jgi:hypothetical protein